MKNSIAILSAAFLCFVFSLSCSKKNSSQPQGCQLASLTSQTSGGATSTATFTYNDQGQVNAIQSVIPGNNPVNRTYSYSANKVILTQSLGNTIFTIDTVTLNSDGLMLTDVNVYAPTGAESLTTYTYSGDEVQQSVQEDPIGTVFGTTTYTWSGGNMVSAVRTDNGQMYTTTYSYSDTATQMGDYWQLIELLSYPAPFIKNADMMTSLNASGQVTSISYQQNNTGKIASLAVTAGASVETITYDWACH